RPVPQLAARREIPGTRRPRLLRRLHRLQRQTARRHLQPAGRRRAHQPPAGWDPATQRSFYDTADTTITHDFYEAMHSLSTPTGQALASVPDIQTRSRLLDVGGGSGAIAIELCRACP